MTLKDSADIAIYWMRRDLRLDDNKAFYFALKGKYPVLPVFIFDVEILSSLDKHDKRVSFIYEELIEIKKQLNSLESDLSVFIGKPEKVFTMLINKYNVKAVYSNNDHEPYGIQRDCDIRKMLKSNGVDFYQYTDHLIMEKERVLKADGSPYSVYTYFKNKFKQEINHEDLKEFPSELLLQNLVNVSEYTDLPSLNLIGFDAANTKFPSKTPSKSLIQNYHNTRDFPFVEGTSRLGVHLRFGTISVRRLMKLAMKLNETFYDELIWREFYANILYHNPRVISESYKKQYDKIDWLNNEDDFVLWKSGQTGYPFVDAGIRQLNETGYMHNRLRMIVAGFLCKHLLIDWRWGEAYFAKLLLDYELSSNNGGWQWSAGSGCDAAPYFRIFNPKTQIKKFDPEYIYVKKWVPEFGSNNYAKEIIDHSKARQRCLKTYKKALNQ